MKASATTLTIGGRDFRTGDRATTPRGGGAIIGLDPFSDTEIGVVLDADGSVVWFGFVDVLIEPAPPVAV